MNSETASSMRGQHLPITTLLALLSIFKIGYAKQDNAARYISAEIKTNLEPGWHDANVSLVNVVEPFMPSTFLVPICPQPSELVIEITILTTEAPAQGRVDVVASGSTCKTGDIRTYEFLPSNLATRKKRWEGIDMVEAVIIAFCDIDTPVSSSSMNNNGGVDRNCSATS